MEQKVYDLIDSYKEEIAKTLIRWIQVPSLKAEGCTGAPFGKEIRKMLDMAIADAEALGFSAHDYDGYACDITFGKGADPIAVLAHLDVVPAGDGWNVPPFAGVRDGDRIIGRGTTDDKGPALAALYAMKAIREAGIPLNRPVKLILGCDEECDWEDMAYYASHAVMPDSGFSPDASFPMINTEKAIAQFSLVQAQSADGLQILQMMNGERTNVIPGQSSAIVAGGEEIITRVKAYAEKTGLPYTAELKDGGVLITAEGIPGHSAYPEGRRNANGMLLLLLREIGCKGIIQQLADTVGLESNGSSLGIACEDAVSGPLTCNLGILHLENGKIIATLDNRVPVTADLDLIEQKINALFSTAKVETLEKKPGHHVPADSPMIKELLAAYHEETGLPAIPQSTGGGTYAKVLKHGVAFGANFPGDPDLAHQANEWISIEKLILSTKIYANAILRICAE